VLTVHRDLFDYRLQQQNKTWKELPVRAASSRRIGALGLGVLGTAVLERLRLFGFACAGWSRSPHTLEGIECYAGAATRGLLGRKTFDALPAGASLINVGRGPHLNQDDLLDALKSGLLRNAILDVTDPE